MVNRHHNFVFSRFILRAVLLLIAAGVFTLSCKENRSDIADKFVAPQSGFPPVKNVLLVVVDTLRADRLGCYGYKTQLTSPNIDKLAASGTIFKHFYAASPWTAPSFGSIFTGCSPLVHRGGMIDLSEDGASYSGDGVHARRVKGFNLFSIDKKLKTVAEFIKPKMDITMAVVSNPFLHPLLGYARGFDKYDYTINRRSATDVTGIAIDMIKKNSNRSFFMMVHYMDLHAPYEPLLKYKNTFFAGDCGRVSVPFNQSLAQAVKMHLSKKELKCLNGFYNAAIAEVDFQIGRVIKTLKDNGLDKNTVVVITSDHGEEFLDHGGFYHGRQFENEVVKVPLVIVAPGAEWGAGNSISNPASHVDLLPTILQMLKIEYPQHADNINENTGRSSKNAGRSPKNAQQKRTKNTGRSHGFEGRSLLPLMRGLPPKIRFCYMESPMLQNRGNRYLLFRERKYAFFDGRYKFIRSENGVQQYMFDLKKDPLEQKKLYYKHPGFMKMANALKKYREQRDKKYHLQNNSVRTPGNDLPKDVQNSLKNLGYMN